MNISTIKETGTQTESALRLDACWLPFTANRAFKQHPRLVESADGFYYKTVDGRKVLDTLAGLWCSGLGHCHPRIVKAVQEQVARLDYSVSFQVSHPGVFKLADRLTALAPDGFEYCFFVNSGSEAVETALKIALGYYQSIGEERRTRLIGRERAYHGVNFGGMSVGGIPANRKMFSGALLPNVLHLPHTHNPEHNAFSRGQPEWGAHLADDLERIVKINDASTIAAVIVEPVSGSSGVLIPPKGYLQRLREICDRHGILLIFDEVITAFGRLGEPFGCQRFDVIPDIIITAKGITNGVVPMGAVLVRKEIYDAFMNGPDFMIEFFHGYTYSGHPLATAAALATLDVYEDEGTFEQARSLEPAFEAAIHELKDAQHVIDIRNFGLMGCVELEPRRDAPGRRGLDVHVKAFEEGIYIRNGMDTLQFCPFLNSTPDLFDRTFTTLRKLLGSID